MGTELIGNERQAAIEGGGDAAVQFINKLGKPDLRSWTLEEWEEFLCVVCGGFLAKQIGVRVQFYKAQWGTPLTTSDEAAVSLDEEIPF